MDEQKSYWKIVCQSILQTSLDFVGMKTFGCLSELSFGKFIPVEINAPFKWTRVSLRMPMQRTSSFWHPVHWTGFVGVIGFISDKCCHRTDCVSLCISEAKKKPCREVND